ELPQRAAALGPRVIDGDAVVLAEQVVAGRNDAVHIAEDGVARLTPIVPGIAHHQTLLRCEDVIDAHRLRVEFVGAGIRVEEVVYVGYGSRDDEATANAVVDDINLVPIASILAATIVGRLQANTLRPLHDYSDINQLIRPVFAVSQSTQRVCSALARDYDRHA